MSYRNPQIIIDRSSEIWADNISKIGQGVANTIQAYSQAKANALAEVKKKDDAYRKHLAKGQELQRRDIASASKNFKGTASQLEDWKKEVRELGEEIVPLQTSNALDTGLTKEQRDANNKKINEYYDYLEASPVSIGGVIDKIKLVAEGGVNPENYGINVISTGTNTMEKFETMVAGFALADVPQDGIKVEKTNSGEPMNKNFGVKYTINSKKYKEFVESGMLNEGSLGEPDGDGNYHGKWERNLKKFGNSDFQFFSQVTNDDNANAALEESGFIKDGKSTGKFLATDIRTEIIDGKEYTSQHINPDIVFEDPTYKAVKIAEAKAILSYGGKDSYNIASTTFNWGKDQSFEKWNNATREQKIDELYKDMFEQDMSRIMKLPNGQLPETRVANKSDVDYYKKMGWGDITEGEDHVWFTTRKTSKIAAPKGLTRTQIKDSEETKQIEQEANAASTALFTDTENFFVNRSYGSKGVVTEASINEGVVTIRFTTGSGSRDEEKNLVQDTDDKSYDVTNPSQISILAEKLYPGKDNKKFREAFVNQMNQKYGESKTGIGESKAKEIPNFFADTYGVKRGKYD